MKIVTWNINSVRLRQDLVARMITEVVPDVICLQETKTPDADFPCQIFTDNGFEHQFFQGMKSYNGVAILSRSALRDCEAYDRVGRRDCRHIAATLANGVRVHNIYIPAGGDVPDVTLNDKFAHKLDFVDELAAFWRAGGAGAERALAVGDFNIAPLEHDVWSHRQLLDVVSHTPIEVEKINMMQTAGAWVDVVRQHFPEPQKLYSWWSYRARDWLVSNRGRRLDHIWATPQLAGQFQTASILADARGWAPKPSDHVPVMAVFEG